MANRWSPYISIIPNVLCADREKKTILIHPRQKHVRKILDQVGQIRLVRMDSPVKEYSKWTQNAAPREFQRAEADGTLTPRMVISKQEGWKKQ